VSLEKCETNARFRWSWKDFAVYKYNKIPLLEQSFSLYRPIVAQEMAIFLFSLKMLNYCPRFMVYIHIYPGPGFWCYRDHWSNLFLASGYEQQRKDVYWFSWYYRLATEYLQEFHICFHTACGSWRLSFFQLKQGALYYVIELQRSAFFLLSRDFTFLKTISIFSIHLHPSTFKRLFSRVSGSSVSSH